MFKKIFLSLLVLVVFMTAATAVFADDLFYPWQDHAAPFDFLFNNLIDNHQQSKQTGRDMLQGFIYVQFTGEERDGVPVAVRADCEDPALDCRVGWKFKGVPISATLVSTKPRVWLVDEEDLPTSAHYLHFQWVGAPQKPCKLVVGQEYEGYLMQRTAVTTFFWLGGNPDKESGGGHDDGGCGGHEGADPGEPGGPGGHEGGPGESGGPGETGGPGDHGGHLVTPGMDNHSNIVTEWDPTDDDSPGGPGGDEGGGCDGHDEGGCDGHDEGGCDGHDGEECGGHENGEIPDGSELLVRGNRNTLPFLKVPGGLLPAQNLPEAK